MPGGLAAFLASQARLVSMLPTDDVVVFMETKKMETKAAGRL